MSSQCANSLAMIRPENVRLRPHGAEGENNIPGMVEEVVYLGFHREVRVRLATGAIVAFKPCATARIAMSRSVTIP